MKRLLVILALALAAPPAHAQATANTEEALRLAYQADEAFAAGRWDEAYDGFAKAEAIAHSPVFVLFMAHSRRNAGKLVEAEALYRRVAREKLPPDAPKPFADAQVDAARELEGLAARVPSLRVVVRGASDDVQLTIDGAPQPAGAVIRLDPGGHALVAESGGQTVRKRVQLEEGAATLEVTLSFAGQAPAEAAPEGSLVPAIVAFSVGGAALVAGAITGGLAMSLADDIKPNCVDGHCLASDAGDLETAQTLALVSTVGFIAGAVGVVAGGVLLFVRPGGGAGESALLEVRVAF